MSSHVPKRKKKRKIMRSLTIKELAGVDVPAQTPALALIMKRADFDDQIEKILPSPKKGESRDTFVSRFMGSEAAKREFPDKDQRLAVAASKFRVKKQLRLTSSEEGHTHLVDDSEDGGHTSHEVANGDEFGHSHPWVRSAEGKIIVGDASGHGHSILLQKICVDEDDFEDEQLARLVKDGFATKDGLVIMDKADLAYTIGTFGPSDGALVAKFIAQRAEALGATNVLPSEGPLADLISTGTHSETIMDKDTKKTAEENEAAKKIEKLEAELKTAKILAEFNDAQRAHYDGLEEKEQMAFLEKSADARQALVAKAAESNPVVYTDDDGNEYRKSDDPRTVSSAKRADAAVKSARLAEKRAEDAALAKRVEEELKHLPGKSAVKIEVLRKLDSIEDEEVRKEAFAMLKASGEKLSKAFERAGTVLDASGEGNPESELERLAEKYVEDHKSEGVDMVKARVAVLDTKEGAALYEKTLNRPPAVLATSA